MWNTDLHQPADCNNVLSFETAKTLFPCFNKIYTDFLKLCKVQNLQLRWRKRKKGYKGIQNEWAKPKRGRTGPLRKELPASVKEKAAVNCCRTPGGSSPALNVNKAYSIQAQSAQHTWRGNKGGKKITMEKCQARKRNVIFTKNAQRSRFLQGWCHLDHLFVGPPGMCTFKLVEIYLFIF